MRGADQPAAKFLAERCESAATAGDGAKAADGAKATTPCAMARMTSAITGTAGALRNIAVCTVHPLNSKCVCHRSEQFSELRVRAAPVSARPAAAQHPREATRDAQYLSALPSPLFRPTCPPPCMFRTAQRDRRPELLVTKMNPPPTPRYFFFFVQNEFPRFVVPAVFDSENTS